MMTFEEREIVRDVAFIDIAKDKRLIQLYNWAADKNIFLRFYVEKTEKEKNYWRSFPGWSVILILIDLENKEIIPKNIWLQKIYLAHEIAHMDMGILGSCEKFRIQKEEIPLSCFYHEIRAWIRGWEILRLLGLVILSEEKKYKIKASQILASQCSECLKILAEKPDQCPYSAEIKNLLTAHHFDLDIEIKSPS